MNEKKKNTQRKSDIFRRKCSTKLLFCYEIPIRLLHFIIHCAQEEKKNAAFCPFRIVELWCIQEVSTYVCEMQRAKYAEKNQNLNTFSLPLVFGNKHTVHNKLYYVWKYLFLLHLVHGFRRMRNEIMRAKEEKYAGNVAYSISKNKKIFCKHMKQHVKSAQSLKTERKSTRIYVIHWARK